MIDCHIALTCPIVSHFAMASCDQIKLVFGHGRDERIEDLLRALVPLLAADRIKLFFGPGHDKGMCGLI